MLVLFWLFGLFGATGPVLLAPFGFVVGMRHFLGRPLDTFQLFPPSVQADFVPETVFLNSETDFLPSLSRLHREFAEFTRREQNVFW